MTHHDADCVTWLECVTQTHTSPTHSPDARLDARRERENCSGPVSPLLLLPSCCIEPCCAMAWARPTPPP